MRLLITLRYEVVDVYTYLVLRDTPTLYNVWLARSECACMCVYNSQADHLHLCAIDPQTSPLFCGYALKAINMPGRAEESLPIRGVCVLLSDQGNKPQDVYQMRDHKVSLSGICVCCEWFVVGDTSIPSAFLEAYTSTVAGSS
jgi:hypothetical protein